MTTGQPFVDDDSTGSFIQLFAALSEPVRVQIIQILVDRAPDELPCTELVEALQVAKSTTSYHMKILRGVGLVTSRKVGRNYFYRLRADDLDAYIPAFLDHLRQRSSAASSVGS